MILFKLSPVYSLCQLALRISCDTEMTLRCKEEMIPLKCPNFVPYTNLNVAVDGQLSMGCKAQNREIIGHLLRRLAQVNCDTCCSVAEGSRSVAY